MTADAPPAMACPWGNQWPVLALPMSEQKGTLRGTSRNASTTCTRQKGAGGPEAVFLLPITQRTTVELEVVSTIDTVVAIRAACDDPLSELACNDTPSGPNGGMTEPGTGPGMAGGGPAADPAPPRPVAPVASDGGAAQEPPPSDGRDGRVRATLNPGTYYVIVDEAEAHGVGGNFTLKLRSGPPAAHSMCAAARVLTDGASFPAEELDVASERPPACTGVESRPALFYSARIPSGQRMIARAFATGGDRSWTPVLQLLSGCGNGRCLARDRTSSFGDRTLNYTNIGPAAEEVILAVSASTAVSAATYRLDVQIGEPVQNGTCASARRINDGDVLRNQDLSQGQPSQGAGRCMPTGGQSLFYSAVLVPQQRLSVVATQRAGGNSGSPGIDVPRAPLFLSLHSSCGQQDCRTASPERLEYTNSGNQTQTVIIEVTSLPGTPPAVFDLTVTIPPAPAAVSVRPTGGLRTTEAGGSDSFEIVLESPPEAEVMIPIESGNPGEGTVAPATVVFGPMTWDKPVKVTVTGVDDGERDGNKRYQVLVKPSVSKDPRYHGLDGDDVAVENLDNEASFSVVGARPLVTSESGIEVTFSVALNKQPTADVTLPLSSSDAGEGTVRPAMLVFTAANWSTPQFVTVTGVDDKETDGSQKYSVVTGAAISTDAQYHGLDPEDVEALNADNEFVPIPAVAVSGTLPCIDGSGRSIAADPAGSLYVALICHSRGEASGAGGSGGSAGGSGGSAGSGSGPRMGGAPVPIAPVPPPPMVSLGVFVAASQDGGASYGKPASLGLSEINEAHVAAGEAGVAYVVATTRAGVVVVRSADSGRTWGRPQTLSIQPAGLVRVASAGRRLLISGSVGPNGLQLHRSDDGGLTFKTASLADKGTITEVAIDAAGTAWLYGQDNGPRLWKSTDGGATFPTEFLLPPDQFFFTSGFGPNTMYAMGKDLRLTVLPLDDPRKARFVGGIDPTMSQQTIVVDQADNVTLIENAFVEVTLRRLPAGATAFGASRRVNLGGEGGVSGVALSDRAIALRMVQAGQVKVAIETFP